MIKINKLYILILIWIFYVPNTFASNTCSIKDTAPSLVDYIKNERQILSNISKDLKVNSSDSKTQNFINSSIASSKAKFIQMFNGIITWTGYFSYFKYYVSFPINNEIPYEVSRDHQILKQEQTNLENFLTRMVSNQTDKSSISNPCSQVSVECPFQSWDTASSILEKLIVNHDNILSYFRTQIMWDQYTDEEIKIKNSIFLLNKSNFETNYNSNTATSCSMDGNFLEKAKKQILDINKWWTLATTWIWEWRDALIMFRCSNWSTKCDPSDKSKYIEKERKLLSDELSRQGLSANATKKMIDNLNTFNSTCKNEDLLSNIWCSAQLSFNNSVDAVKSAADDFQNLVWWMAKNFWFWKNKAISNIELQEQKWNNEISNKLKAEISELYNNWKANISDWANNRDKVSEKVIQMIVNVSNASKILDEIIDKSREVCNKQLTWLWDCN